MKTKKLTITVVVLVATFNLIASVIIITNGYKTIRDQKILPPNNTAQNFITSLIDQP